MIGMQRRTLAALAAITALGAGPLVAQQRLESVAIRGATIHTLAGAPIQNGTVVVQNGVITAVGANAQVPAGVRVIDANGLHVYPGLFDAMSALGLTEIGAVDVTNDRLELGEFNPHLSAATAVHPASEHIPVARANGITHAAAAPDSRAGGVGGQAVVIDLDGWTVEEMLVIPSVGMVLEWPTIQVGGGGGFGGGGGGGQPPARTFRQAQERYQENVRQIETWLESARRYGSAVAAGESVSRDLRLEALARVTSRELAFLVTANSERDIRNAVEFMKRQNLRMVLLSGTEAWKVRQLLAENAIPVITGPTQSLPSGPDEGYDERYAAPGLLHQAGVKIAFGTFNSSDSRTLPYEAASSVSFGFPRDEALRAVTVNGAEILGIADKLGTIEVGKLGNLIVTDGDPLEITTQIRHVIIGGRDSSLYNRHLELYEKYRSRPLPPRP